MDKNCYLCKRNNTSVIRERLRHSIKRRVLKCGSCGLVYLEPKRELLGAFYNKEYRNIYTPVLNKACSSEELFNIYLPQQQVRIDNYRHLFNRRSRVLEIGCSTGHFLYALKPHVRECVGVETNSDNAEFARRRCKIKVYASALEDTDLPKKYFDTIFLLETLEHLKDPVTVLKTTKKYLKSGGNICVQVPNLDDILLSVYNVGAYEEFYYREPHLFYFNKSTLLKIAKKAGFIGQVSCYQEYGFINHMHWILNNRPMGSFTEGVTSSLATLLKDGAAAQINRKLQKWSSKTDSEYKIFLKKNFLAQSIVFCGKVKQSE